MILPTHGRAWSTVAFGRTARKAGKGNRMDMVVGSIAVIVWLVVMVPAAFVFLGSSDPDTADALSATAATPDNLTQLPRAETRTDDRLAA